MHICPLQPVLLHPLDVTGLGIAVVGPGCRLILADGDVVGVGAMAVLVLKKK